MSKINYKAVGPNQQRILDAVATTNALKELSARVTALEMLLDKKTIVGPCGPRGEHGERGADGADYTNADVMRKLNEHLTIVTAIVAQKFKK